MPYHPIDLYRPDWRVNLQQRLQVLLHRQPELRTPLESVIPRLDEIQFEHQDDRWRIRSPLHYPSPWSLSNFVEPDDANLVAMGILNAWEQGKQLILVARPDYYGGTQRLTEDLCRDGRRGAIVIEPDPVRLLAVLALANGDDWFRSTQIFWCCGPDIERSLAETFFRSRLYLIDDTDVTLIFGNAADFRQSEPSTIHAIQQLGAHLQPLRTEFLAARERYIQSLNQPFSVSQMRVFGFSATGDYIHQFLTQSMLDGLRSQGIPTQFIMLQRGIAAQYQLVHELVHFRPTSLLGTNELAEDTFAGRLLNPEGVFTTSKIASIPIPRHRIVWVTDEPMFYSNTLRPSPLPFTHVFVADRLFQQSMAVHQPLAVEVLPVVSRISTQATFDPALQYPLVFLGAPPIAWELLGDVPLPLREWIEQAVVIRLNNPVCDLRQSLQDHVASFPHRSMLLQLARQWSARFGKGFGLDSVCIAYLVDTLANAKRRMDMLKAFLPLGLKVAGSDQWLTILPKTYRQAHIHWDALRDPAPLYRSASINLNIHSLQLPSAVNLRVVDIIAAGGFVLSDWVQDFDGSILTEGKEVATFRTIEEGLRLAQYYLNHPDERKATIDRGQERLRRDHTLHHRAQTILDTIRAHPLQCKAFPALSDRQILQQRKSWSSSITQLTIQCWQHYMPQLNLRSESSVLLWVWDDVHALQAIHPLLSCQSECVAEMRPYHLGFSNPELSNTWFGMLEELPALPQTFDMALLLSGIEAVRNRSSLLHRVRMLIKPKGRLFIGLPNVESMSDTFESISPDVLSHEIADTDWNLTSTWEGGGFKILSASSD